MAKLLMISTDNKIFDRDSAVAGRMIEYAKNWEEVDIIVLNSKFKIQNSKQIQNPKFQTNDSEPLTKNKKLITNNQTEISLSSNCFVYSTDSKHKILAPFNAIKLGSFIIHRRKITNITCQDPFLTAMAGISLKKQFHIPIEIQIHTDIGSPNFTYTIGNKIRKAMALSYLKQADHVRVVSNRIKDYLIGKLKIDPLKIELRPIKVDIEKIKIAPILSNANLHIKYPQFEKIILMASRLEKEKNISLAIQAMKEICQKKPKTGMVIVGSGSEKDGLIRLKNALGLTQNVIFEDWADQATLYSYYKTADVFLNTSLFEGYGMTLVEAQAAGCKIVSTDVGVAREVGAEVVGDNVASITDSIINIFK